jgi:hypothetical protein
LAYFLNLPGANKRFHTENKFHVISNYMKLIMNRMNSKEVSDSSYPRASLVSFQFIKMNLIAISAGKKKSTKCIPYITQS